MFFVGLATCQIGESDSTDFNGTKAALQSMPVPLPGEPVTVTPLLDEGTMDDEKLTGPGPKVNCVLAGEAGPPLWASTKVGWVPSNTTLSSVIFSGLFWPLRA
ncbi:hypothetical protein ACEQUB_p00272 (plasmid) [Ralstonia syzygii]